MKKILQKFTTGSPILDGVIGGVILLAFGVLFQRILNLPLVEFLTVPIQIPLWIVAIFLCAFIIFVKRHWFGSKLKSILVNRKYRLIYNTDDGRNKEIGFGSNRKITEGQNDNEYSWRILSGKLEIFGSDGKVYSRFRYDKSRDQFLQVNDPDRRSLKNQLIEPIKGGTRDWASEKG